MTYQYNIFTIDYNFITLKYLPQYTPKNLVEDITSLGGLVDTLSVSRTYSLLVTLKDN